MSRPTDTSPQTPTGLPSHAAMAMSEQHRLAGWDGSLGDRLPAAAWIDDDRYFQSAIRDEQRRDEGMSF